MKKLVFLASLFFIANTYGAQWAKDLRVSEPLLLKEFSGTATATPGFGLVYTKSADNDLYFMDSLGNEFNVLLGTGPSIDLNYLSDVDTISASPTAGQALVYNGSLWTPGNISSTLAALSDVDVATATTGEFLKFDGLKWINSVVPQINALNDIGDVNVTGAVSGQVLGFNGTDWVPATGGKTLIGSAPIVITQDATTATISFDYTSAIHNNLSGLNGAPDYYHLSQAKYNAVQNLTASGTQTNFTGDVQSASCVYYGDSVTNGSYRDCVTGGVFKKEKRVSGSWSEVYRVE